MENRSAILAIIVFAQFACVSLWFAGNGVLDNLIDEYQLNGKVLGHLTSAVQLGFIIGTLFYAFYSLADRISPSKVFFFSAIIASLANLALIFADGQLLFMYGSRFITGFFLAGIYPVGMKIAADYFDKDLGKALGYLLGALVLGTAFPHLLQSILIDFPWQNVIICISALAVLGGTIVYIFVPDGPFRKKLTTFDKGIIFKIFRERNFRATAFGYFGHMWELYAFWTFIPVMLATLIFSLKETHGEIAFFTFYIIATGSLSCIIGGYIARRVGSYKVAFTALALSGTCCLVSPLVFTLNPAFIFVFLLFWGFVVIMDSPQFSTLIAQTAPAENKGSALTIVNCLGFAITIVSIQLLNFLSGVISFEWLYLFLFPGPLLGLLAMLQREAVN